MVIRDLLRGLVAPRLSNLEASDWNMTEMILDPNVPGCVGCHRARRHCSASAKTSGTYNHTQIYSPQIGEEYSTWNYAISVAQGLTKWEFRKRRVVCKRHLEGKFVEITEDSLEW